MAILRGLEGSDLEVCKEDHKGHAFLAAKLDTSAGIAQRSNNGWEGHAPTEGPAGSGTG